MDEAGILTNRNFLLLWSGNAASLVGFHGVRIAYPLLVLAVTGSAAAAGWIALAMMFSLAVRASTHAARVPAGAVGLSRASPDS